MKFIFSTRQTISILVIFSLIFFVFSQIALAIPDDGNRGNTNNTGNDSGPGGAHEQRDRDLDPQGGQHRDDRVGNSQTNNDSGPGGAHEQRDRDLDPQGGQHRDDRVGWAERISSVVGTIVNEVVNVFERINEATRTRVIEPREQTLTFGLDAELPRIPRLIDDPELSFNLPKIPKDILLSDNELSPLPTGEFPLSYSLVDHVEPSNQVYIEAGPYFSGYYSMYTPLNLDGLSYKDGIYALQQEAAKSSGEVYAFYIRRVDGTGFWWEYGGDSLDGNLSMTIPSGILSGELPTEFDDPGTTVIFIHTHPDIYFQSENIPPSAADLALSQVLYENKVFGHSDVVGVVVTSVGGWAYRAEKKIIDGNGIQRFLLGEEVFLDQITNDFLDKVVELEEIYGCDYSGDCSGITDFNKFMTRMELLNLYKNHGFGVVPLNQNQIYR